MSGSLREIRDESGTTVDPEDLNCDADMGPALARGVVRHMQILACLRVS